MPLYDMLNDDPPVTIRIVRNPKTTANLFVCLKCEQYAKVGLNRLSARSWDGTVACPICGGQIYEHARRPGR
jgi:hypothetical protein